ncbi:MAG TPA: cytochrome o ubiquinol oxidase subunit IV [Chlamydiales bacterium]|nr:cytochrome o ubiquinol oxidase subunit IV [Chlamydiales bacterium]
MSEERSLREIQKDWPQTLKLCAIGFIGSLLLTALSFSLTAAKLFSKQILIPILVFLALTQAIVQLIFFMHMGKEAKPRWMMLVFYFMILVIVIVVLGSLWIITDLNHRVMMEMK